MTPAAPAPDPRPRPADLPAAEMRPEIAVGVRELVEFVLRRGDLRAEFTGAAAAAEAVRLHQRIQASRPPDYLPEVALARTVEGEGLRLRVGGRLDGVFTGGLFPRVEEIKTTRRPLRECLREENPLHWGQARIYAFLYAAAHGHAAVEVQLTYARTDSGATRSVRRLYDVEELAAFFDEVVGRYLRWAEALRAWAAVRDASIRELAFPFFSFRPGQQEMIGAVREALRRGGRIFIQAPTGIGKTLAVLYPAVRALAERSCEKIFYLTARTTGRLAAESALAALRGRGLRLKHLALTAREKACLQPGAACTPEECGFAAGHYDRLPAAREALFREEAWTREAVAEAARAQRVCPFELSLDLARWADLVACDYNYAFDPRAFLRRFFLEEGGPWAFLVDEAHNLAERSREMFSAELRRSPLRELGLRLGGDLPAIRRRLEDLDACLAPAALRARAAGGAVADPHPPAELLAHLDGLASAAEGWLEKNRRTPYRRELEERYFEAAAFLRIAERFDEAYATCWEAEPRDLLVKLFCVDPARPMAEALRRCRAAVFFSATLSPPDYFRSLLGGGPAGSLTLPSPFPERHFGVFVADTVSTVYRDRARTCGEVARMLRRFVEGRRGNYLLFFPSYEYLRLVLAAFRREGPRADLLVQEPGMGEAEREAFLARFEAPGGGTLVGFAVMGGAFGEGIDLAGARLSGAAVVGVGLPAVGLERELIRAHFAARGESGYDYAYRFPGIQRVLQAAGRVIRSEDDRGVLLLLDRRYAEEKTRRLLPPAWKPRPVRDERELAEELARFWDDPPGRDPRGGPLAN